MRGVTRHPVETWQEFIHSEMSEGGDELVIDTLGQRGNNGSSCPHDLSTYVSLPGVLLTAGGCVAILMTLFTDLTKPRRRLEVEFTVSALPRIREFLFGFAAQSGWDTDTANRLDAGGEETLLTLIRRDEAGEGRTRRLLLVAYKEENGAVLEFIASTGAENLQDRIALLGARIDEALVEQEISLRLLRHLASSVRHQQYHGTDIVTLRVEAAGPVRSGRT